MWVNTFLQQQNKFFDIMVTQYLLANSLSFHQTFFGNSYCNINICILLNHLHCLSIHDSTHNIYT